MKIVVAVTGASGSVYAKALLLKLNQLQQQVQQIDVVFSETAKQVWQYELAEDKFDDLPNKIYPNNSFFAPFASGSANYEALIICPCSMGTLGRIAAGTSDDLISRTADVMLKQQKKLILVPRETPLNLIHIRNMETITLAGGIICPASPSFYSIPKTIDELVSTVTDRILDLLGLQISTFRWNI